MSHKPPDKGPKQTVLRSLVTIRFADAEVLLSTKVQQRFNGAMYMAGYGIECALKARICADRREDHLEKQFRHHDFRRLAEKTQKWAELPEHDTHRETLVVLQTEWDVHMRYEVPYRNADEVRKFIGKARDFTTWLLQN